MNINISSQMEYLKNEYQIDSNETYSNLPYDFGFSKIDKSIKLRQGVYLLGGLPSVGKTTFLLQLANRFAEQGSHILFFSLEQSKFDITNKSINQIAEQENIKDHQESLSRYLSIADRITIADSSNGIDIDSISTIIKKYCSCAHRPIIFIDYLQSITAANFYNKKDVVDFVSKQIVSFSKTYKVPIFVISSLNRMNYTSEIDFESFKESGSLEYDADVVFGLQYQAIGDKKFSDMNIDQKRRVLNEAKSKPTRDVELVCLKHRFGKIPERCCIKYYTQKDFFVEASIKKDKTVMIY